MASVSYGLNSLCNDTHGQSGSQESLHCILINKKKKGDEENKTRQYHCAQL